jgi:Xaa-Pro aminopeptidase
VSGDTRARRVAEAARRSGGAWAVLTSVDAVCYASGLEVGIEAGPSPFAGGPVTALVSPEGAVGLVVTNLEEPAARACGVPEVRAYEGLGFERQAPYLDNYARALEDLAGAMGVGGVVAVEERTTPSSVGALLEGCAAGVVGIDAALDRLRAVKTDEEIARLRRSAELTAVGQRAALHAARAGRTELEVFADVRLAMESAAGRRLPVTGDLLSGRERTAQRMGWPGNRPLEPGDPVLCDLAPRLDGYWGDSCNTLVVGSPSRAFLGLVDGAREGLEHAVGTLRPGISAGAFARGVQDVIEGRGLSNRLHVGHGIGTSVHEFPRLVPGEAALLEPGMVLMVEPGAYDPAVGGVRLEWMFLVTEDGCEVLSPFEHTLEPA